MGKSSKKRSQDKSKRKEAHDPLDPSLEAFKRGDYLKTRKLVTEVLASGENLSEGAKRDAGELVQATRLERGTVLTGLGALAFFGLVICVAIWLQP